MALRTWVMGPVLIAGSAALSVGGWKAVASRPGRAAARLVPASGPSIPRPVRVLAVGDLMLGTNLREEIAEKGAHSPFRPWRDLLAGADLTVGNLETPLSARGEPTRGKSPESLKARTNFIFRAPPAAAEGLAWAGFDAVSAANNHTMDYGPDALLDTLQHCRDAGVAPVGGGPDLDAAREPVYLTRGGQTFAIFGISDVLPLLSVAGKARPGIAPARGPEFEETTRALFAAARKRADRILVLVHWGVERYTGATEKQTRLGRKLVDWGADAVIGAHTHVLGPTERYGNGVIHYSLGNFLTRRGSRRDVAVWELVFRPGEPPAERTLHFRWNGKPAPRSASSTLRG